MEDNNPATYYQAYNEDPTIRPKGQPAPFQDLFRFADQIDTAVMVFGSLCAAGVGCALIRYANPLGDLVNAFASNKSDH